MAVESNIQRERSSRSYTGRLLALLIPHAYRWRYLYLGDGISTYILSVFERIPANVISNIESLEFSVRKKQLVSSKSSRPQIH